jgi:hypothetical protein
MVANDVGAGLFVRMDRRREGVDVSGAVTGDGEDSFLRFAGWGAAVGDGVGRVFEGILAAGLDEETGLATTAGAEGVVLAEAAAALPDLLYEALGSGVASTTAVMRSPRA